MTHKRRDTGTATADEKLDRAVLLMLWASEAGCETLSALPGGLESQTVLTGRLRNGVKLQLDTLFPATMLEEGLWLL